jgi:hypothetical protein
MTRAVSEHGCFLNLSGEVLRASRCKCQENARGLAINSMKILIFRRADTSTGHFWQSVSIDEHISEASSREIMVLRQLIGIFRRKEEKSTKTQRRCRRRNLT